MANLKARVIELSASQIAAYPAPPGEDYYFLQATDAADRPLYKWSGIAWAIASIFGFVAPLTTTVVPTRAGGSPTATFTRATTATVTDWENIVRPVLSGEVRFQGARRVQNVILNSSTLNPFTAQTTAVWTANNVTGPDGVANSGGTLSGSGGRFYGQNTGFGVAGSNYTFSIWMRAPGTIPTAFPLVIKDNATDTARGTSGNLTLTSTWTRYSVTNTTPTGTAGARIEIGNGAQPNQNVELAFGQIENVTGQSNTNPSEYVSVGVLSAPYQGANVDGVQYFSTQNGNTVASNVVTAGNGAALSGYKWGILPGVAGSYFSTPDSTALGITGDIDVRWYGALNSWGTHPSVNGILVAKHNGSASRSWEFQVANGGTLTLRISLDGATFGTQVGNGVAITTIVADGVPIWLRVTRIAATGAVAFYYSRDGANWIAFGTGSTTAGNIATCNQPVTLGMASDGASLVSSGGRVFFAEVRNSIGGTPVAQFYPSNWTSGATFASPTTEVWTIVSTASIFDPKPMLGYLAEGARTNLCLQSEAFDSASWGKVDVTVTANTTVAPDGNTTADTLTAGVAGTENTTQAVTITSNAICTFSKFMKMGNTQWTTMLFSNGVNSIQGWFDLQNGVVGSVIVGGTGASQTLSIKAFPNGWYRCTISGSIGSALTSATLQGFCTNANVSNTRVNNSTRIDWGAQFEDNVSFASSYLPTTTVSVTRNADVLTYPSAGNISDSVGSAYAEFQHVAPTLVSLSPRIIAATGAGNGAPITTTANTTSGAAMFDGATAANGPVGATPAGTLKVASYWGTLQRIGVNGNLGSTAAFGGSMGMGASIQIGFGGAGQPAFSGTIRNVKIATVQAPDTALQAMTT